ncbi:MAG: thioredoxin fold domain-containing protein [Verrucomicrobiota bacterium]
MFKELIVGLLMASFPTAVVAGELSWETDYKVAEERATEEGKVLLISFTGSDWCQWCRKLEGGLFADEDFVAGIEEMAVLLRLDFPQRKRLPVKEERRNRVLKEKWGVEDFPTVIVFDVKAEKEVWRHGYVPTSGEDYLEALREVWEE